ncbi:hypothetical protein Agub_g4520 [Astrephomene gubernaculifera]|uniref:FAD-binding PCMH-type domain-containing protein n=1 Tax=Astrephomene gubernaculifera TaxID=47775 RepID=A0AAD3DKU6_9CHLO|nr:hypothetical protein Agub_g4520 [Astrephomene gubernaculifera]
MCNMQPMPNTELQKYAFNHFQMAIKMAERHHRVPCFLLLLLTWTTSLVASADGAFCLPSVSSCWPTTKAFNAWRASLGNNTDVYFPDKQPDMFLSKSVSMNLLKSNYPGIIVVPATERDLRLSVAFAFANGIRVVAMCSGHDFNGRSTGRGIMLIKTDKLKSISYDATAKTITFGSGNMHGDIYSFLAPKGRVYVGGQSKTVCPAGCLAGGCHGLLSRQYGLGSDNIIEIQIVLYNGTAIRASKTRNADLFNAYLGAGQNSFGVALSFTARTFPAPPAVWEINVALNIELPDQPGGPNVLNTFIMNATWFNSLPLELAGNIHITGSTMLLNLIYTGKDSNAVQASLGSLFRSPFITGVEVNNYTDVYQLALNSYPPSSEIWQRKFIVNGFVPPQQPLLDGVADIIITTKPDMWLWFVYGGAVRKGTVGSVPPGMRDAMYQILIGTQWNDPNEDEQYMAALEMFVPSLYGTVPYSYNNEYTSWGDKYGVVRDWKTRFFANYDSLLSVKDKYDPCNFFTVQYGVASDLPKATCKGGSKK